MEAIHVFYTRLVSLNWSAIGGLAASRIAIPRVAK
jgi:hypothetical protein